jgi:hypothetical protein
VRINLHIERLVLDGLPLERRDGPALQVVVREELSRLLAAENFTSSQAVATAKGSPIIGTVPGVDMLGRQIASSIHGGLTT